MLRTARPARTAIFVEMFCISLAVTRYGEL